MSGRGCFISAVFQVRLVTRFYPRQVTDDAAEASVTQRVHAKFILVKIRPKLFVISLLKKKQVLRENVQHFKIISTERKKKKNLSTPLDNPPAKRIV